MAASSRQKIALLIIDMINTLDFPEGRSLKRAALPVARKISRVKKRFQARKLPVIYINDNFGDWKSDWKTIYAKCSEAASLGADIARILKPDESDFFILKPGHSGFHQSSLEALLKELEIKKLLLTGIAGDICVLFTAQEAHMRGYDVKVARDCVASNSSRQNKAALEVLSKGLKLATPLSTSFP